MQKRFGFIFIGIIGFIMGFAFSTGYMRDKANADKSLSWPSCVGTVEQTHVRKISGPKGIPNYEAVVDYVFTVNGQTQHNYRFSFPDPNFGSYADAETQAKKYPVNSQVPVFYDPGSPSMSCLVPGESTGLRNEALLAVFGAVIFVVAAAITARDLISMFAK